MKPADAMQLRELHATITAATQAQRAANHAFCRFALELLDQDPTMSITDIARIVGVRQPTMHNKLAKFNARDQRRQVKAGAGKARAVR